MLEFLALTCLEVNLIVTKREMIFLSQRLDEDSFETLFSELKAVLKH